MALPLALCFKHSMGSNNVGSRNRTKEESELTHTHLSFKLWFDLSFFYCLLWHCLGLCASNTAWGHTMLGRRKRAKEESELTHTHLSFKFWLWLVCFFIVFCGIASGYVLQTKHGVTQCWAEEQSPRRVWINTYQSILQTLTLTCLFFYCLLWHCLWLCASNTAWGHTMLGRGT